MAIKIPKIEPLNKKSTPLGLSSEGFVNLREDGFVELSEIVDKKKKTEKLKNKSAIDKVPEEWRGKNGGPRPGAGRPAGSMNTKTVEQKKAMEYIQDRVERNLESIVTAQLSLAKGVQMLFKIEVTRDKKGNEMKSKPILVTSEEEIKQYLDGEFEGLDSDYYFMTTERPDNRALDSLLDRTYGRAKQTLDLGVSKSLEDILRERRAMKEQNDKT